MTRANSGKAIAVAVVLAGLLAGCVGPGVTPAATPTAVPTRVSTPAPEPGPGTMSADAAATLSSLQQVDDYPLYTMRYQGAYTATANLPALDLIPPGGVWACSLFAALGDRDARLYGRNFDWEFSPAVLLFMDPPGGYASAAMVDIAYLGFAGARARGIADLPLEERMPLLDAPSLPFDGMNERGLVVGMAAVPDQPMPRAPGKPAIGSLGVIREMLDHAATVDEAAAVLERFNVDMSDGPALHYLIADRAGSAALVEFFQGEMKVFRNEQPWHQATNFLLSEVRVPAGQCWRYDRIAERLTQTAGELTAADGMALLQAVSQDGTQWSVTYGISANEIRVAMGRAYDDVHSFALEAAGP